MSEQEKKVGLLVEDQSSVEVHTKDGDALVKTNDREKTLQSLKESGTETLHG